MSCNVVHGAILALVFTVVANTAFALDPVDTGNEAVVATTRDGTASAPPHSEDSQTSVPAGTPVTIALGTTLASSTHKRGDVFPIVLAEPLLIDGAEYLPAGTPGTGQITHAATARGGGAPGELMIAARTLETPNGPLRLGGFKLGGRGEDNSGMALGVSIAVGPFAMFIRGREIVIPAGTRGIARIRASTQPASANGSMTDPINTLQPGS